MRQGFRDPPPSARLRCYWWWLNGHTDKTTITHDLEQMRAKGFGGVLLVDADGSGQGGNRNVPPGPTFGSPAWIELYTHALREADRLGLEVTLNITSGWNLGGPGVAPEQASKLLTWTRTGVNGGSQLHLKLAAPPARNGFYREIAVLAYPLHHGPALASPPDPLLRARSAAVETGFSMPDSSSLLDARVPSPAALDPASADSPLSAVRNLSSLLSGDGSLTWAAPPGPWEILRIGYTNSDARVSTSSGAWQGFAIDYMSRLAFDTYWNHTVDPLLSAAKPFHSLKYLATDSWELGGTNWTDTFAEEFRSRRGYDPIPWLAVVAGRIIDTPDSSARFLTDLRRTVADLIVANHYDRFAERAAQHGLGVQAESGGPHGAPIDALETFRRSAVPQSEFWSQNPHRHTDEQRFFTKEAASAANIYGQRIVAQEGETSIGPQWSESLATDLKPSFDMAITEGMNRLVWHEFTSSPASTGLPGQEYFAGTHINPKVTWWNAADAFFTCLNRVQFLMQQGTPVDDVLYLYGDNVPAFVRLKADDPAHLLPGYDYDVVNEDALLHSISIASGKLVGPSGVTWRALALPTTRRLSLAALVRIEHYVHAGGTLIGEAPLSPTGLATPADQARFQSLARSMWGGSCDAGSRHDYGSGRIVCTQNAHAALESMGVPPDLTVSPSTPGLPAASSGSPLDYAHRRLGTTDLYFVRNGSASAQHRTILVRAHGNSVQLWDPVSGDIRTISATFNPADGRSQLTLDLPAFGSAFLVFTDDRLPASPPSSAQHSEPLRSTAPWTLAFQPGRGAPPGPVTLSTLQSWTASLDPGIRYFSGTATYRTTISAPPFTPVQHVLLHFTEVREIARVRINGHDAGTVWAKPLTLRVDPWLTPGSNELQIDVTNLWPNRIIGDLQPGAHEHVTQTNITTYRPDSPLLPSGLIGPLEWLIEQ